MSSENGHRIDAWVETNGTRLIDLMQRLVRQPSENRPPSGSERTAQEVLAEFCREGGFNPRLYDVDSVEGLRDHPLRNPAVDLSGRPNLSIRIPGCGTDKARSLLLSGHIDTVPSGDRGEWTRDPFGGEIEGERLYGRGAYDMKSGLAASFMVPVMLRELGLELSGDLLVESVIDEEFAGGHGTIAGRLAGDNADAVILTEPSQLGVYRAHRGLRIARLTLLGKGGVTFDGSNPDPPIQYLPRLIEALNEFGEQRRRKRVESTCYREIEGAANTMITKVRANEWADDALLAVPERVEVEFFWEVLPSETQETIEMEFEDWLAEFRRATGARISHQYALRWLAPYELEQQHPLVATLEEARSDALGECGRATGAPFPCDLYLYPRLGVPAGIIIGPRGGNAHAPDEWVDLNSIKDLLRILGRAACAWCHVEGRPA